MPYQELHQQRPWRFEGSLPALRPNTHHVTLDGSNEYISLGDVAALQFERTDPFSISCWVKRSGAGGTLNTLFAKREGSGNTRGYGFVYSSVINAFRAVLCNVVSVTDIQVDWALASTEVSSFWDGTWHHVCLAYTGSGVASGLDLYLDGVLRVTGRTTVRDSLGANTILNAQAACIGARDGINFFDGAIDEMAVYDAALATGRVREIWNLGVARDLNYLLSRPNLVGWWQMDEGTTGAGGVLDKSVNANHGTATNMEAGDFAAGGP